MKIPRDKVTIERFLDDQFAGYRNLKWPDLRPGASREIDATFDHRDEKFAVEHTRIVRFRHEAPALVQFKRILIELEKHFDCAPDAEFCVLLPCRDYGGKRKRAKLIKGLAEGLPDVLARLRPRGSSNVPLKDISLTAWIYRRPTGCPGIEFRQFNPQGSSQYPQFADKIFKKLTKLQVYKTKGYKIVLLLENSPRDSASFVVTDSVLAFEQEAMLRLDELWEVHPDVANEKTRYLSYDLESFRKIRNASPQTPSKTSKTLPEEPETGQGPGSSGLHALPRDSRT